MRGFLFAALLTLIPFSAQGVEKEATDEKVEKLDSVVVSTSRAGKDTKNLRNNGRMRVKFDKWLVHIPFLCYLTILLI